MSDFQIIYLVWLAGVFILCKPCWPMWVTLANAVATLAICGAVDVAAIGRSDATLLMMISDIATASALIFHAGFARVLGLAFAVSAAMHLPALVLGVSLGSTFALVYLVNVVQLGVLSLGSGSDHGMRRRFRFGADKNSLQPPRGNLGLGSGRVGAILRVDQE